MVRLLLAVSAVVLASGCEAGKPPRVAPLVFVKARNLYVYDFATHGTKRLTSRGDAAGDVAVSPDARRVAYTAAVRQGTDIRLVALKGSSDRDLTPWPTFAGVHTHVDPGWLDAKRLIYMDDQRAASAAGGVAHVLNLRTGRRLPKRALPPPLRGFVEEPLVVHSGVYAWSRAVLVGRSWCEHTEDLWESTGGQARRLTRTPQIWESPLDSEPQLPLVGSAGQFVSGHHSGGCTSDPKAKVQYELRSWQGASSTALFRFPPSNALAPRAPEAAWSPDGKQLAVVDPAGRLSIHDKGGTSTVVVRRVSAIDW